MGGRLPHRGGGLVGPEVSEMKTAEQRRIELREYNSSPHRKAYLREYMASEKGKEAVHRAQQKYVNSKKGKEARRRYQMSAAGREAFNRGRRIYRASAAGKAMARKHHLKRNFGLSEQDYETMFSRQNGCCAICGSAKLNGHGRRLVVDHDHATTKVRELLCHPCNSLLGYARDKIHVLANAISYLKRHGK